MQNHFLFYGFRTVLFEATKKSLLKKVALQKLLKKVFLHYRAQSNLIELCFFALRFFVGPFETTLKEGAKKSRYVVPLEMLASMEKY